MATPETPVASPQGDPRKPSAAATLSAAGRGGKAAGVATVAPTLVVAGVQARAIAAATTQIVESLRVFARGRQATIIPLLQSQLTETFSHRSPDQIAKLISKENAREAEFLRRQASRMTRDLPKVLAETDVAVRQAEMDKLMAREQRYMAQREKAMTARAHSVVRSLDLEEASPEGAFWLLGGAQHHTPGCLAMAGKFWPWPVLRDVIQPPVHPGCPCHLISLDEAVSRGLMRAEHLPEVKDALLRARRNMALEEAIREDVDDDLPRMRRLLAEYLVEAQKRYAKGMAHGGEFAPSVGGDFAKAKGALKKLFPKGLTQRGEGRHVWLKGNHTLIPLDRSFSRKIGGTKFTSPAGSTNVYRDGKLASVEGEPPRHADLHPPKGSVPAGKISVKGDLPIATASEVKSTAEMAAQVAQRLQTPKTPPVDVGQDGKAVHEALLAHGFVVRPSRSKATKKELRMSYVAKSGHQIEVKYGRDSGRVDAVSWKPDFQGGLYPQEWEAFQKGHEPAGFASGSDVPWAGGTAAGGHTGAPAKPFVPKPPPPPVTHEPLHAEPVTGGPIPNYDHVQLTVKGDSHAGGSQGAKIATAADGSKWLLKTYGGDEDRIATEVLSNAVYRALGAKAADAGIRHIDGKAALSYPLLEGESHKIEKPSHDIGKHFMADALVGNWDFIGLADDNVLWGPDGKPIRVDQGGTLQYRAMGEKKGFGPVPSEVWSMMSPKGQGFGKVDITDAEKRAQAAEIAKRMTPAVVDHLVDAAPFTDERMRSEVRDSLHQRVAWMDRFAKGEEHEPEPLVGADAAEELAAGQSRLSLFPEQEAALHDYEHERVGLNASLLDPKANEATPEQTTIAKEIDSLLRHVKTTDDVTAFAGLDAHAITGGGDPADLVGKTLSNKGFLDLTLSHGEARTATAAMQVLLPQGSKALYTRGLPGIDVGEGQPDLIGARHSRLRIVAAGMKDGKVHIEAVMLP